MKCFYYQSMLVHVPERVFFFPFGTGDGEMVGVVTTGVDETRTDAIRYKIAFESKINTFYELT